MDADDLEVAHARSIERRLLQVAVLGFSLVPVGAGSVGGVLGPSGLGLGGACDIDCSSHFRYLSGLLLAIGLTFWALVPNIERAGRMFAALTFIVFVGGLLRALGLLVDGSPSFGMIFALIMELVVTPGLCLWQIRIGRTSPPRSAPEF